MTIARTAKERQMWFNLCMEGVNACSDHESGRFDAAVIAEVLFAGGYGDHGEIDDTGSFVVGRTFDGRFAAVEESSDTSGHG